jgi:hypothetical protein
MRTGLAFFVFIGKLLRVSLLRVLFNFNIAGITFVVIRNPLVKATLILGRGLVSKSREYRT